MAEEFAESLRSTPTDALPLEITLLAFVYNYR
jgi:hypothetical protein